MAELNVVSIQRALAAETADGFSLAGDFLDRAGPMAFVLGAMLVAVSVALVKMYLGRERAIAEAVAAKDKEIAKISNAHKHAIAEAIKARDDHHAQVMMQIIKNYEASLSRVMDGSEHYAKLIEAFQQDIRRFYDSLKEDGTAQAESNLENVKSWAAATYAVAAFPNAVELILNRLLEKNVDRIAEIIRENRNANRAP